MMWTEINMDILATFADVGREYQRCEEPTPRQNKFG
jgi:hypothetical protein